MKKRAIIFTTLISLILIFCSNAQSLKNNDAFAKELNLNAEETAYGVFKSPENHSNPNGKQINIAYVILKTKSNSNKTNFPLIYLSGGPGGKALTKARIENLMGSPFRENRDIIVFDQRGIGYSSALLNIDSKLFAIMAKNYTKDEEFNEIYKLLSRTKTKIESEGIALANYNTFQNAKDVGALMVHLGYEKYNLLGTSYGTTLARVVQELYPEKLNSVIHNSPSPLDSDFLMARLESYQLALQRLFNWCKEDAQCANNYKNLNTTYLESINNLKSNPITLQINSETFTINAQDGVYLIRRLLYINRSKELVPRLINALKNRDSNFLSNIVQFEKRNIGNLNFSMFLAMSNYNKHTSSNIASIYKDQSIFPAKMGFFDSFYQAGKDWHSQEVKKANNPLKDSKVPTLISVNYYDPVTPPKNGHTFMKKLSSGQLLILDEGGHGNTSNPKWHNKVFKDFMDNPKKRLDTSCLNLYIN